MYRRDTTSGEVYRRIIMNDTKEYRLGVVLPLANEARTVIELLDRMVLHLDADDIVLAVIDNSSVDDTKAMLTAYCEHEPKLNIVWAPENRTVVDAYLRGYREALARNCRWILEMDGGFSHIPEEIPLFISAMEDGYDFVAGSRYVRGGSNRSPLGRRFLSYGGTLISNFLLGTRMTDMTSGFQCFSKEALEHVLSQGIRSKAHFLQTEIRYTLRNWNWKEIPINYCTDSRSVGFFTLLDALTQLIRLLSTRSGERGDRRCPQR